jgi:hypothetical protein
MPRHYDKIIIDRVNYNGRVQQMHNLISTLIQNTNQYHHDYIFLFESLTPGHFANYCGLWDEVHADTEGRYISNIMSMEFYYKLKYAASLLMTLKNDIQISKEYLVKYLSKVVDLEYDVDNNAEHTMYKKYYIIYDN